MAASAATCCCALCLPSLVVQGLSSDPAVWLTGRILLSKLRAVVQVAVDDFFDVVGSVMVGG